MEHGRRTSGDSGAAVVEFAFVAVLLLTIVFGIIQFGLILSFKQDMTRAAAEGARGGAVAFPATNALQDAEARTTEAIRQFGQARFEVVDPCATTSGMNCRFELVDCSTADQQVPTTAVQDCVLVEVAYTYKDQPIFGEVPLISAFYPEVVRSRSVAKVND